DEYGLTVAQKNQRMKDAQKKAEFEAERVERELRSRKREIELEVKAELQPETAEDIVAVKELVEEKYTQEAEAYIAESVDAIRQEITTGVVHEQESQKEEKKKKTVEDDIRSNLRGFARAIPSFIMAYGD